MSLTLGPTWLPMRPRVSLSFRTIISYIDEQFERYLHDESGLNRRHIVDNRVHCCFYFISPFGHGLKPLDVAFMKAIHNKVNIVPVIAKADTLTLKERERLKKRVRDVGSRGGGEGGAGFVTNTEPRQLCGILLSQRHLIATSPCSSP